MLPIFGPRPPAVVERRSIVRRNGSTPRELYCEYIHLLALKRHDDASVFAAPAMDDGDRCGEDDEAYCRDPNQLLWGDILGHQ
jgi:hypothetical protein